MLANIGEVLLEERAGLILGGTPSWPEKRVGGLWGTPNRYPPPGRLGLLFSLPALYT